MSAKLDEEIADLLNVYREQSVTEAELARVASGLLERLPPAPPTVVSWLRPRWRGITSAGLVAVAVAAVGLADLHPPSAVRASSGLAPIVESWRTGVAADEFAATPDGPEIRRTLSKADRSVGTEIDPSRRAPTASKRVRPRRGRADPIAREPDVRPSTLAEQLRLLRAIRGHVGAGRVQAGLASIAAYERRFAGGEFAAEVALLEILAQCRLGRGGAARRGMLSMQRRFPDHPLLGRARDAVARLSGTAATPQP